MVCAYPPHKVRRMPHHVCLLQKPATETAYCRPYILNHLINAIGSQQVSALDKLIWLDECYYSLLTLNSSKTEFMLIGLPQQLRKNLWKITCCYNYFCSQLWLNIDEHLTFYDQSCLYCLKCTKFCQLILRKIIKIVVTRCHILRLKCTKFNFGWGFVPDPAGGAYSAPPDP